MDFAKILGGKKIKKKVLYSGGKFKTGEVGLQTANWSRLGESEFNPDEVGIATYKRMMKDAEVRAGFNLIKFSTLSRNWKIIYPEKSKNSKEIVGFLRYAFDHMDGRLSGSLSNLLLALPYGFATSEIVYKIIKEGQFKGKVGIKKLKGIDSEQITFKTDKYGNLVSVTQDTGEMDSKPIKLPMDRLIIYTNEKEFGNYYGTSRLRAVYKNWFIKDQVTKFWNISLERFGMPMLIGKVPSSKELDAMKDILANAQARSSLATVEGWEVAALETGIGRSSGGDYKTAIDYHNGQILKGLLVPGSLTGGEAGGSFAKSKVGFEVFQLMLKSLEVDLCGIVEQYLIKQLVEYNFGELDEYPQFVFEPLTNAEFLELAKVFALLVRNGVVGYDEEWMRHKMRIPVRTETTISRDTRTITSGESGGTPNPPPETRIIKQPDAAGASKGGTSKTKKGGAVSNKKTVGKPTQQIKEPKTSRNTGLSEEDMLKELDEENDE